MRRCVALSGHPHIVQLLDIAVFRQLMWVPSIGFVLQRYDSDVRQFLKKQSFTRAGMRHVLSSILNALVYTHGHDLAHADLKTANIFLKGRGPFRDGPGGCKAHGPASLHQPWPLQLREPRLHQPMAILWQLRTNSRRHSPSS